MNIKDKIKKIQNKQSGYTMIELLLVIAIIIALTSVMIYALVSRANKQAAIHECAAQVSNIVVAERAYIERDPSQAMAVGPLVTMTNLKMYGLDSKIADLQGIHTNPWGGNYAITTPVAGIFTVTVDGLPSSVATNYQTLQNAIQRLTEHDTAADAGTKTGACIANAASITCTFDNA